MKRQPKETPAAPRPKVLELPRPTGCQDCGRPFPAHPVGWCLWPATGQATCPDCRDDRTDEIRLGAQLDLDADYMAASSTLKLAHLLECIAWFTAGILVGVVAAVWTLMPCDPRRVTP